MKNLVLNYLFRITVCLIICFFTFSVKAQYPNITSIDAPNKTVGSTITINGSNFSADPLKNAVFFGAIRGDVISGGSTSLTVKIPTNSTYAPLSVTNLETNWTGYAKNKFDIRPYGTEKEIVYRSVSILSPISGATVFASGDLDGDGKLDLVSAHSATNNFFVVSAFENGGTAAVAFSLPVVGNSATYSAISVADLDGDTKQDIIITDSKNSMIYFLRNKGTLPLAFDAPKSFSTGLGQKGIAIADLDKNGRNDVVVVNSSGSISVFLNSTLGTILNFTPSTIQLPSLTPEAITLGDLDEDGLTDMVVIAGKKATLFHNGSSPGTLLLTQALDITSSLALKLVEIADLDQDGKNDIIMSNGYGLEIYKNTNQSIGIPAFGSVIPIAGVSPASLAFSDADGNGLVDIYALSPTTSTVKLILNKTVNGTLTFAKAKNYSSPAVFKNILLGGFDGYDAPSMYVLDEINGKLNSFWPQFYVAPPKIDAIAPLKGKAGDAVVITGSGFSTAMPNVVLFGTVSGVIQSATENSITVQVPVGVNFQNITVTNTETNKTTSVDKPFKSLFASPTGIRLKEPVTFNGTAGTKPVGIAETDVNNDGYPDLAVVNSGTNSMTVFLNGKQNNIDFATKIEVPIPIGNNEELTAIKAADWNGDGWMDFVILNKSNSSFSVMINNKTNPISFTYEYHSLNLKPATHITVADLDQDGQAEVIASGQNGTITFYKYSRVSNAVILSANDFTIKLDGLELGEISVGDLDQDGKPDLLVAMGSRTAVLHNDSEPGSLIFKETVSFNGTGISYVKIGDLNNDGKNDIIAASSTQITYYQNTNTQSGIASFALESGVTVQDINAINLGDMDGDGYMDLIANSSVHNVVQLIFRNTSTSNFSYPVNYPYENNAGVMEIAVGDIDRDGRTDIMSANSTLNSISVLKNSDGPPVINSFSPLVGPVGTEVTLKGRGFNLQADQNVVFFGAALAKVKTVVSTNELVVIAPVGSDYQYISLTNLATNLTAAADRSFNITYTTGGPLNFKPEVPIATGTNPRAIVAKDLNGDGLVDFAVAHLSGSGVSVYKNTSDVNTVSFASPVVLIGTGILINIKIADLSGDGLPDIVANDYTNGKVNLFLNQSNPIDKTAPLIFGNSIALLTNPLPTQLELADVNADGSLDIVTTSAGNKNVAIHLNLGDGNLNFKSKAEYDLGIVPLAITVGDLNEDGYPEIAAVSPKKITILAGNTAFVDKIEVSTNATNPTAIAITDFDANGKMDLILTEAGSMPYQPIILKLNNGNSAYAYDPDIAYQASSSSVGVALSLTTGDINGDGFTDLGATYTSAEVGVHENMKTTTSNFINLVPISLNYIPQMSLFEDVNGDGKLDLILLNNIGNSFSVLVNNQVTPTDVETLPATNVVVDGVTLQGRVRANTSTVSVTFDYSQYPDLTGSISQAATLNPSIPVGANFVNTSLSLNQLAPGTWYYRVSAINEAGVVTKGAILSVEIPVTILAIVATSSNPVVAGIANVNYRIDFSGEVSISQFNSFSDLISSGAASGSIILFMKDPVDPKSYNATVHVGTGDGTLALRIINADFMKSIAGTPIVVTNQLPFIGDTYVINHSIPAAPMALSANEGDALVKLTWTANTESDLASYEIYGGTSASPTTLIKSIAAGTSLTYTHAGLQNGTTYYYRITAKDVAGNEGPYSNEVNGTPQAGQALKLNQTITFAALADKMYGDAGFDLQATSDQGLEITYTSASPSILITNKNHVEILHAGTATIFADQSGDATYNEAGQVSQILTVLARPISIKASAMTKVAGSADPALTYFVAQGQLYNGDVNVINGVPVRDAGEILGAYLIHQGTVASNADYDLTFIEDYFTITAAPAQTVSMPQALSANPGDALVKLTWAANPEIDLAGYEIYGGTSASPTTLIKSIGAGALTYTDINLTNGATYYYRIVAKVTDGTVSDYSNEVSATPQAGLVPKTDQTITFAALANKTYGDADLDAAAVASSGLAVTYTSSDNNIATIVNGKVHILHAGTVTIYADQTGNGTYAAAIQGSRTLTINPLTITVTADVQTKAYGTADPVLTYTYTPALIGTDVFTGSLSRIAGELPAGYAKTKGTLALSSDYILVYKSKGFIIDLIPLTVTADAKAKVSGTADPVLTYTLTSGSLIAGDAFSGALSRAAGENVGSYAINQGTLTAKPIYNITFAGANLVISPAVVKVVSMPQGLLANPGDALVKLTWAANPEIDLASYEIYGGTSASPTTLIKSIAAGALTYTDVNLTNGTTYYYRIVAKVTGGTLSDYSNEVSATPQAGQVPKTDQTITFAALADRMYGDAGFDLLPAKSDQGLDITYSSTSPSILITNKNHVEILHAGTATIFADQSGNATYNAAGQVWQELTILSRPISVKASAATKVAGTADPMLTYFVAQGQLYNGDVNVITGMPVRDAGEMAGVYKIHQGTVASNADYDLTFIEDDFTITAAQAGGIAQSITFAALANKTYGDADFDAAATASSGLPVTYTSSDNTIATIVNGKIHILHAGTVTIYADQAGNGTYAAAMPMSQTLTISPLAINVTADVKAKVYGTVDPIFTYSITSGSLLVGDVLSGTLSRAVGENVGSYAINQGSLTAGANYSITLTGANLTISPVLLTVSADMKSKNVGDADPVLTYTYSPVLIGTDVFTGNLDRAPGEGVGTYAIGQGSLTAGNNYMLSFVPATLGITLKSAAGFKLDANNILTPNGDGKNDRLVIKGLDQYPTAKITIVDREGRIVYQSGHYQNDFDGTYNGRPLSSNTYYYILDFGKEFGRFRGFITIINE